ncbi:amidohydrolase 3 [Aspergillus venezuelensis]
MNAQAKKPVDVVYTDGEIIVSPTVPAAQAIFIQAGHVAAVGSNEEVILAAGESIPTVSLKGAVVIPGLIDTHSHLLHFTAFTGSLRDITKAKDHADILNAIRQDAKKKPKGSWIMLSPVGELHWLHRRSHKDLEEGCLPDRYTLDIASTDHPVIIAALAPKCPNIVAFNSLALEVLGIGRDTPNRVNDVWVEKDDNGYPTGILRGQVSSYYNYDPFFAGILRKMPNIIQPDLVPPAVTRAMKNYNGMGITAIYEGHAMEFNQIEAYQTFCDHNLLSLRVKACPELTPGSLPTDPVLTSDDVRANLERAAEIRQEKDDWLRISGVTTCPLPVPMGEVTTGRRGVSQEHLEIAFDFCARRGLRLNLCSVSPDEHDDHLAMTEKMMDKHNLKRTGWILQHGMLIRPDQIKKLAELGFDMTVSSAFTYGSGDLFRERVGPECLQQLNPFRQLLDAGLNVAASMDWGPINPFEQMQLAVTHEMYPSRRTNAGLQQVVTRAEAFDMWTRQGAKVLGWEGIGELSPGSHADLAIVDRNPITCDLDSLPATRVLRTLVGGSVVHDDGSLPSVL